MDSVAANTESLNSVMAYLEVTGVGAKAPMMFPLHDEVVIGREAQDSLASEKFLCIPEHTVSRRHARIRRRSAAYFVEDLHSFNGTFVLGERLTPGEWRPLRDGDELMVSSVQIVFHSLIAATGENAPSVITKTTDATQWIKTQRLDPASAPGDLSVAVQKLHAMAQVGIALGGVTDRATLIEKIMNLIFELFPLAERAFILLKDNDVDPPTPLAARRRNGAAEDAANCKISRTIIHEVLNKRRSVLSVDTLSDRHFGAQDSIVAQAIRSVMCVPLLLKDEVLGLIQLDTSSDPYAFKEDDLEMLTGVCAETAVVLKNFQLYSDIERLLDGFVRASVQAIEERDPVTAGHSFRVAEYAERLALAVNRADCSALRRIAFTKDQLREIRYAALLHDFGKVGVREHILRKEKKLHHFEMRMLEQRFKHAKVCLERREYQRLTKLQADGAWSIDSLREERRRIDENLREEFLRLDGFLEVIRRANEPAILHTDCPPELRDVLDYAYHEIESADEGDGSPAPLLEECEFSALSISKGCLTREERRQIESHVADSYSFLILIPWTRDLAGVPAIVHGHHEKLDGSGYPLGLRGDEISVQCRILTICDIYDALTAGDRPYKKAAPVDQALDLMAEECRAGRLDAGLFDVFVDSKSWAIA